MFDYKVKIGLVAMRRNTTDRSVIYASNVNWKPKSIREYHFQYLQRTYNAQVYV